MELRKIKGDGGGSVKYSIQYERGIQYERREKHKGRTVL